MSSGTGGDGEPVERCWICGRTTQDVQTDLDRPTSEELEVARLIEMVESSKKEFESRSVNWEESMPVNYKELTLDSLLRNTDDYKSVAVLEDIARSKRFLLDGVISALECIRSGKEVSLGVVQFKPSDERHRSLIERGSIEFHKVTGKILNDPALSKEINVQESVRVVREAGLLYFWIQRGLLSFRMEDAIRNRPDGSLEEVPIVGLSWPIRLCTVCRVLVESKTHEQ
jgi:hypothetical protein